VITSEFERVLENAIKTFKKNKQFILEKLPYNEAELLVVLSRAKD
jgi:hypothetical protein